jgi:polyhydroxyalkanoate synthesis regulator phasin
MKAKTLLEIASLSTAIYTISKETQLFDKLIAISEQGRDKFNEFIKEQELDENGKELEMSERILRKLLAIKDEIEDKIAEIVKLLYDKMNLVHTDEMANFEAKIEVLNNEIALLKARLQKLENS